MASNVVSDNFETGTGGVPQLGGADRQTQWCKAWVNFNGTGTVAIRDSYNVSSITDNATGRYTVNLGTAMANANYSISLGLGFTTGDRNDLMLGNSTYNPTISTTGFTLLGKSSSSSTQYDIDYCMCQVFGD